MDPIRVSRHVVRTSGLSDRAAARKAGRNDTAYTQYIYGRHLPSIRVMAELCDACGFDLLVRSRKTGEETLIDPPQRE